MIDPLVYLAAFIKAFPEESSLKRLTKLDLDKWTHTMIQTYDITRKKYVNVQVIMRQTLDYAVDMGIIEFNPMSQVRIDRKMYRRVVQWVRSSSG